MNGAEHYREAERLLAPGVGRVQLESFAGYEHTLPGGTEPPSDRDVAQATVHATLALAAATALQFLPDLCGFNGPSSAEVWREVIA